MTTRLLVRAPVQRRVYLIDPIKGHVYNNNPDAPLFLGILERCDDKQNMSKSDGCLVGCRVRFRPDLKEAEERYVRRLAGHPPS